MGSENFKTFDIIYVSKTEPYREDSSINDPKKIC